MSNRKKKHIIRVLYLIGELGYGGSERQLYLLLKHLDKSLFETQVLVFNRRAYAMFDQELQQAGTQINFLPDNYKGEISRSRYIYTIARCMAPHVLHSWSIHDNPYAGLVGWAAGVPVRLGSVRGSIYMAGFQNLPRYLRWLSLHSVQGLVANSPAIAEELRMYEVPVQRIHVLRNCVELFPPQTTPADLSQLGIQADQRLVGTVGNLRGVKNQGLFVETMALVISKYPDARGLIVGQPLVSEASLPEQLANQIDNLGLSGKVILTGFRKDIPELLSRFNIFCLTSNSEGTPNALLEAMAASLPVVATRVGGVPEVVENGVHGFLVEPGDAEGTARAICRLLEDPGLALRMGQAGRQRVAQDFDPAQTSQRFSSLYLDALRIKE